MENRRKEMLAKLNSSNLTEEESILTQLTIERICSDMCDFYERFYAQEGPGATVYVPDAEKESDTMFYLTVSKMIAALDDFRNENQSGPEEIMQKAIARAEALDPSKEGLFIIQDKEQMSLIHYNKENPVMGPVIA